MKVSSKRNHFDVIASKLHVHVRTYISALIDISGISYLVDHTHRLNICARLHDRLVARLHLNMARENGQQASSEAAMQLLSKPDQEGESFSKPLRRGSCCYEDQCERFRVKERRYKQQYASLYFLRLAKMRQMVEAEALKKWGKTSTENCSRHPPVVYNA